MPRLAVVYDGCEPSKHPGYRFFMDTAADQYAFRLRVYLSATPVELEIDGVALNQFCVTVYNPIPSYWKHFVPKGSPLYRDVRYANCGIEYSDGNEVVLAEKHFNTVRLEPQSSLEYTFRVPAEKVASLVKDFQS